MRNVHPQDSAHHDLKAPTQVQRLEALNAEMLAVLKEVYAWMDGGWDGQFKIKVGDAIAKAEPRE